LADDPSLTYRNPRQETAPRRHRGDAKILRRVVLDSLARIPVGARIITDHRSAQTMVFVSDQAPKSRVEKLRRSVEVIEAPGPNGKLDLRWILRHLGKQDVTSLLVEGGGEVNGSFLLERLAHRVAFFYAPKVLGGRDSRRAVGGEGVAAVCSALKLRRVQWRKVGEDLLLEAALGGG